MAGYIGSKAVLLSTTAAVVTGDADIGGDLTVDTNTLFVDAANNRVGVGTATPLSKLDVASGNVTISNSTNAPYINFVNNTTRSQSLSRITMDQENDTAGQLLFSTATGGTLSERMRINSSGSLLVGTTTILDGNGAQFVNAYSYPKTGAEFRSDSTAGHYAITFHNPFGLVGAITTSGSATSYNTSSDYRLKENVVPLAGAADRLAQIPVHRFNFIADPDRTVDGFLAHEVQAFVPECVTGTKDQVATVEIKDEDGNVIGTEERPVYQGIDQSKLVPLLTAALQEALQKIDALEARIVTLEGGAA